MNSVNIIGRITKDPEVRYAAESQTAVCRFSVAIDRGKNKDGESRGTDFPNCVAFGKTAELMEKYVAKGKLLGVVGRIQTGKYETDGRTVYTTDVVVDRLEFLSFENNDSPKSSTKTPEAKYDSPVDGFSALDSDSEIPF